MTQRHQPVPPEDYRAVFEHTAAGARILEELLIIFRGRAVTDGGIDAVLKTYLHMGERRVIDHIVTKINLANTPQRKPAAEEAGDYLQEP